MLATLGYSIAGGLQAGTGGLATLGYELGEETPNYSEPTTYTELRGASGISHRLRGHDTAAHELLGLSNSNRRLRGTP